MMSEEREVSIMVKVTTIRDGTHGVSMAMPDRLIGEWTDSGASLLAVTDEYGVRICGSDGVQRYLLTMPGVPLRDQQVSDTEAAIVVRM